jgi:hypothetical protein
MTTPGARNRTWVDYHAPKDGKVYGIAMFDHPKNPRFPTWWHVRSYALFAANPFGQHDFEVDPKTKPKTTPAPAISTIPAGQSVTFRWRFYFHVKATRRPPKSPSTTPRLTPPENKPSGVARCFSPRVRSVALPRAG